MTRLTPAQGEALLLHGDPIELGQQADAARRKLFDNTVTFIVDRNINYTNVCKNECKFCAFFRRKEHKDAYLLSYEEILAKVRETAEAGGTQVMIQGGLHPDLGLPFYEEMLRRIKANFNITIHSFTATEIQHFARQAGLSVLDTLKRLQAAGLDSLPVVGKNIAQVSIGDLVLVIPDDLIDTVDGIIAKSCDPSCGQGGQQVVRRLEVHTVMEEGVTSLGMTLLAVAKGHLHFFVFLLERHTVAAV